jgi:hypothetical protein
MSRTNASRASRVAPVVELELTPELLAEVSAVADVDAELEQLLSRAAALASARGLSPDAFVHAAWEACLEATPGLRAEIEEKELRAELRKLRKRGLVGQA